MLIRMSSLYGSSTVLTKWPADRRPERSEGGGKALDDVDENGGHWEFAPTGRRVWPSVQNKDQNSFSAHAGSGCQIGDFLNFLTA